MKSWAAKSGKLQPAHFWRLQLLLQNCREYYVAHNHDHRHLHSIKYEADTKNSKTGDYGLTEASVPEASWSQFCSSVKHTHTQTHTDTHKHTHRQIERQEEGNREQLLTVKWQCCVFGRDSEYSASFVSTMFNRTTTTTVPPPPPPSTWPPLHHRLAASSRIPKLTTLTERKIETQNKLNSSSPTSCPHPPIPGDAQEPDPCWAPHMLREEAPQCSVGAPGLRPRYQFGLHMNNWGRFTRLQLQPV